MKFHYSKLLTISVCFVFFILFIIYAEFFYLVPLKNDLNQKQQTLQSEQKVFDALTRNNSVKTVTIANTTELQQKVPVKPMQDQFILDLEKAEIISNSTIKSMSFSNDNLAAGNSQNQANNVNGATSQNTTKAISIQQSAIPASIKKLTVQLSVESPSYEQFETFVSTLESLQRIVVVEAINYTGEEEMTNLEQTSQPFFYNLTVSAYYMPNLEALKAQLPKIDAPPPAGKNNPLAQFPNVKKP
ncbi:type 4a pilus biogenesis protein PilO [Neobacillus fumarioli]|uniref:type 4a pilus biogenesis protein PilO n=1 Tax=Neobacillus fumarioli TaxID=105229 RepID=UPI000829BA4F|nr:hypothetical protein [Neobacillus fumarioli]